LRVTRRIPPFLAVAAAFLVLTSPAFGASNDPGRAQQWALSRIHADQAWTKVKGAGITIAVVDTGIDLGHPDLKSKIVAHYDCTGGSCVGGASAGNDDNGHGSHVAGTAAAATGNGIGIAGVAPSAKLMAVKVLNSKGNGYCSDIVNGIRWASEHGARVINLSLGPKTQLLDFLFGNSCVSDLQNAAEYAFGRGDVVVISAGNQKLQSVYTSPALEVVGATGPNDEVASYSNTGANIYAPGGNAAGGDSANCTVSTCILSTYKNNGYALDEGTSMAAPHISGLAALLLSEGYSNAQAVARINKTADMVNGIPRANAARAVGATRRTSGGTPTPTPRATHHSTSTPTPTVTHKTGKPISVLPKVPTATPSVGPSPSVLGVGPTLAPGTTGKAAGASVATSEKSRALEIALGAFTIAVVGLASISVLRRRARRA
jgi:subtilisin family serine protease